MATISEEEEYNNEIVEICEEQSENENSGIDEDVNEYVGGDVDKDEEDNLDENSAKANKPDINIPAIPAAQRNVCQKVTN
jgi:hypothetical protein